jgi:hypothetical protein
MLCEAAWMELMQHESQHHTPNSTHTKLCLKFRGKIWRDAVRKCLRHVPVLARGPSSQGKQRTGEASSHNERRIHT